MARIRTIKPDFFLDAKIKRLSHSSALFFIGLWTLADDYGYFPTDSLELALKIGRWRVQDIKKTLRALVDAGLVRCSGSVGVGMVIGWEHQRIKDRRASKYKDLEIEWDETEIDARESDENRPVLDRKGEERKGREGERFRTPAPEGRRIFSSAEELKEAVPIITREIWGKQYPDPRWLEEQISKCFDFHSSEPAKVPQSTGKWLKHLHSWLSIGWERRKQFGNIKKSLADLDLPERGPS